ncbi:MAG: RNA methyltransferase [Victivallales bacterium]|nr:RNA methyltransferase [Victivallales bacterium]MCF7889527.1 RNA methyltransferase [Victivallales bacterium]
MLKLTSTQNPKIKFLSKLINRRTREKTRKTLLEGYRLITRALEANFPIEECYFCPELFLGSNENRLLSMLESGDTKLIEVTAPLFKKIAYRDRPEGLIALSPIPKHPLNKLPVVKNGLYLVVEAIEKPGNLGSILRSADAAGANGLIICDRCTDIYNPNVLRASTGAIFYVPVAECSSEEAHDWLKNNNIKTLAATPHTKDAYYDVLMTKGTAIITGTEQYGLSDYWLKNSDKKILIPMKGKIDSLNVAIATSILLFEASRQRNNNPGTPVKQQPN